MLPQDAQSSTLEPHLGVPTVQSPNVHSSTTSITPQEAQPPQLPLPDSLPIEEKQPEWLHNAKMAQKQAQDERDKTLGQLDAEEKVLSQHNIDIESKDKELAQIKSELDEEGKQLEIKRAQHNSRYSKFI